MFFFRWMSSEDLRFPLWCSRFSIDRSHSEMLGTKIRSNCHPTFRRRCWRSIGWNTGLAHHVFKIGMAGIRFIESRKHRYPPLPLQCWNNRVLITFGSELLHYYTNLSVMVSPLFKIFCYDFRKNISEILNSGNVIVVGCY